ncbi:FHA domain-containing protein [Alkalilimnicola sp. S0819]|uniref:FHA domain-containing protein n=1 Tax=Alkalilimnicola sp. S0819 TaxID=2613922 RepID=UPI001869B1CD|nr:FHA domain-containing protein [Alkalilimnicola sp. S0819]
MQIKLSLTGASASISGAPENNHVFDERGGVIGREPGFGWTLPCARKLVSRKHAVVSLEADTFYLYDGSTNGVFHNGAAQPIGTGGRVALAVGDELRIGEYTIAVESAETAAEALAESAPGPGSEPLPPPAPSPTPTEQALAPEAFAAEPAPDPDSRREAASGPFRSRPAPDLGHTAEAFQPPAVLIPEDWDLQVAAPGEGAEPAAQPTVAGALNALAPPTARALLAGLRLEDKPLSMPEPGPELVGALAQALRLALQGAFELRQELDAVERRASRGRRPATAPRIAGEEGVPGYLRALLRAADEPERDRLLFALHDFIAGMRGRLVGTASCLEQASRAVVEQFAPEKLCGRYRLQRRRARGLRRLGGYLGGLWNPAGARWRHYRRWYAAQQAQGHRAVRQLLEKKFIALYAERAKGPAAPARR